MQHPSHQSNQHAIKRTAIMAQLLPDGTRDTADLLLDEYRPKHRTNIEEGEQQETMTAGPGDILLPYESPMPPSPYDPPCDQADDSNSRSDGDKMSAESSNEDKLSSSGKANGNNGKTGIGSRFDDLLKTHIGGCGRYQTMVGFLLCLVAVSNAFYIIEVVFIAAQPPGFLCSDLSNDTAKDVAGMMTANLSAGKKPDEVSGEKGEEQCFLPRRAITTSAMTFSTHSPHAFDDDDDDDDGKATVRKSAPNQAAITDRHTALEPVPCTSWTYEIAPFADTIVAKWSLVCSRSWLIAGSHSAFLVGTLLGVLSGGFISDRFGRKPALVGYAVAALAFRVALVFSPNIHYFIAFRFFIGLTNLDTFTSAFVLGTELVGPSKRVLFGTVINQFWAVGYMLVPGIAYVLRDTSWQTLSLTLTGLCSYVLLYICLVPESPRWQLTKGKHDAAYKTLSRMAKVNGRKLPDGVILDTIKLEENTKITVAVLKKVAVRWRSIIVMFVWFSVAIGYYGLTLNVGILAGNLYLNTFIMGAVEVPAYFLAQGMLGSRLGRRGSLALLLSFTAVMLLAILFMPKQLELLITTLAILGKLGVSAAYMAAYVITAELYPTNLRQVTLAVASTVGRIGGTVAPFIGHLSAYGLAVPVTIYGTCCLMSAIVTLLLPETCNRPLPSTLEDLESGKTRLVCCTSAAALYDDHDSVGTSESSRNPTLNPLLKSAKNVLT